MTMKKNIDRKINNKYSSLKIIKLFPIFLLCFVIFLYFAFNYLFKTYTPFVLLENDGFMIKKFQPSYLTGNTDGEYQNLDVVTVNETEYIYKVNNLYVNDDRSSNIDVDYPLFVNEGLSIVNYNNDINLIDKDLVRTLGYRNLVFSYGNAYNMSDYTLMDNNTYLLISYPNGIFINLFDLNIKTEVNEYNIPINSLMYFETDRLVYFERSDKTFTYKEINDIDYDSILSFVFESSSKEYRYKYEEFLDKVGSVSEIEEIVIPTNPIIGEDEQIEVVDPSGTGVNQNPVNVNGKWVKPSVVVSDLKASVYSVTGKIEINDPAGVIVKAPAFSFLLDGKPFLKKSILVSGNFTINGLAPETTFNIVGQYTYLDQDLKTKKIVTFYSNTITTLEMDELDKITLSVSNGKIYSNKIEFSSLKITSDINSEALKGAAFVAVTISGEDYFLPNSILSKLLEGEELHDIATSESLQSNREYDYTINFYDNLGNKLNVINNTGHTRTSKKYPTVSIKVLENEADYVLLNITLKNPDRLDIGNYRYTITNTSGQVVKNGSIDSSRLRLEDLDPNQMFRINIYGDIDADDGNGLQRDYLLLSDEFTSLPITSLGFVNMKITNLDSMSNEININAKINVDKTDARLLKLLKSMTVKIYNKSTDEEVKSYTLTNEEVASLTSTNGTTLNFSPLASNTLYRFEFISKVQQGETVYYLDCIQNLNTIETTKQKPIINIENSFVTKNMIDYDVSITDVDGTIISNQVRVELRELSNKLIDSRMIPVNGESVRITYNYLKANTNYNIIFIADEYNETNNNSTYISKNELLKLNKYTEDGISGKIELISAQKVATGENIADINSEIKWMETYYDFTIPKTVDENGYMHLYSKGGYATYMYDLSEYHGQIATVSFKIKSIVNKGDVYFGNNLKGYVNSKYCIKLNNLSTDNWATYTFTFRVGSTISGSNYLSAYDFYYGKNELDFVGFFFQRDNYDAPSGEYLIKDFDIRIISERHEIDISNYTIEKGSYNRTGDDIDNYGVYGYFVRVSDGIPVKAGKYYEINFNDDTNYEVHVYFVDNNHNAIQSASWNKNNSAFSPPKDCIMYVHFRKGDGSYPIDPEEISFSMAEYDIHTPKNGYKPFEYEFVTKIRVNLVDLRNEISNDTYYIRVCDENKNELFVSSYQELADTNEIIGDIKDLLLENNQKYYIQLFIKIRNREYELDFFELNTDKDTYGISETNEWAYLQPKGNYIVLNNLDFKDFTVQKIGWGTRFFSGTIDFQGYSAILYSDSIYFQKIGRIEKDGVLKNLVLEVHLVNTENNNLIRGFVANNNGTIENVFMEIYDERPIDTNDRDMSGLADINNVTGIVRNFVVKLCTPVTMYKDVGLLVKDNYGLIENGYVYGEDGVGANLFTDDNARRVALIQKNGGIKSTLQNVYAVSNIISLNETGKDYTGLLSHNTDGILRNAYTTGKAGIFNQDVGPVLGYKENRTVLENVYYYSNNIYTMEGQNKITAASLRDISFQKQILGDGFNVDDMIYLGYYPQVKFTYDKMPKQDYIDLPQKEDSSELDILSIDIVEQTYNTAITEMIIDNVFGDEIIDIGISNVETEILSQTYENGKTILRVKVSNPEVYTSKYEIRSIKAFIYSGGFNEKRYSVGEKYLYVDFYREISSVEDWLLIKNYSNQNFAIINDLDFSEYINYSIDFYSGKIIGNNHKLKNINIGTNNEGLFNQLNGSLRDVVFENTSLVVGRRAAIIAYANQYAFFDNIHVNNINITVMDDAEENDVIIGGLFGSLYYSRVSNCSITNLNITSHARIGEVEIGGLVGSSEGSTLDNVFVQDANLEIINLISAKGIGGIVGREKANTGGIYNSFVTGIINADGGPIGGIVGKVSGSVKNSYANVNIISVVDYIGGIVGIASSAADIQNNLYLGNIAIKLLDYQFVKQIVGDESTISENNYGVSTNLLNFSSFESQGEGILAINELYNEEAYNNANGLNLGDYFDYSLVKNGILPKLRYKEKNELLPYQNDIYFNKKTFHLSDIIIDKRVSDVSIRFYFKNADNSIIDDIVIDGMNVEIINQVRENGMTVIDILATPIKYFDAYLLNKIKYHHEGEELYYYENQCSYLEMVFYKELWTYDDWQNISTVDAENYILMDNIDFTGLEFNTGIIINRLETEGDDVFHTISGMNLDKNVDGLNVAVINRIDTILKNINFENIKLKNADTHRNNYYNFISVIRGKMQNISFTNVEIDAEKKSKVSIIGLCETTYIDNIRLKTIMVNAHSKVASLIAEFTNLDNNFISNIDADDIHITALSGDYVGGIISELYRDSSSHNITHVEIKNSSVIGLNSSYVGGIGGFASSSYSEVNNVIVKGKNNVGGAFGKSRNYYVKYVDVIDSDIEGSGSNIGGITGEAKYLEDSNVYNTTIKGTSVNSFNVGGIFGTSIGYTLKNCTINNSTIVNNGNYTGGIIGNHSYGSMENMSTNNVSVIGNNYTGGLSGSVGESSFKGIRITNTIVSSNGDYAGGFAGFSDNSSASSEISISQGIAVNTTVSSNRYAGGYFGNLQKELYNPQRVNRLFFDGEIYTDDGETANIASGLVDNEGLMNAPNSGFHEEATINGEKLKNLVNNSLSYDNLIENLYSGYLSETNGNVEVNVRYPDAHYSDYIRLDALKTYKLFAKNFDITKMDTFRIRLYDTNKVFVADVTNNNNTYNYLGNNYYLNNVQEAIITPLKNCYIRILYFYNVSETSLVEVEKNYQNLSRDRVFNSLTLRNPVLWNRYLSNNKEDLYYGTYFDYSSSLWDFSVLNNEIRNVEVPDKSGNGYIAVANVSGILEDGILVGGANDQVVIDNYHPGSEITISADITSYTTSRTYEFLFSYRDTPNNTGVGLYISNNFIWARIDSIDINTNCSIPLFKEVNISMTYAQNNILKIYLNGRLVYTNNYIGKSITTSNNSKTYIASDDKHNTSNYKYLGLIRKVFVYNRALESSEIAANYSSALGITNNDDLSLYYDFSELGYSGVGYYPIFKDKINQSFVPLPNTIPNQGSRRVTTIKGSKTPIYRESLEGKYHVYSSGVDTINIEFDTISNDLSFDYSFGNYQLSNQKASQNVYTLYYDYASDINLTLKNAYETKEIIFTREDLAKTIQVYNEKYYHIEKNKLYQNNDLLYENALHIYQNLVLLSNNHIYNLQTKEMLNHLEPENVLSRVTPLYEVTFDDKLISTYYNFTEIVNSSGDITLREGSLIYKNNYLYSYNVNNNDNSSLIVNNYNGSEYQIVLGLNGELYSYKTDPKFDNLFINSDIKEISADFESNLPIIMIKYHNNQILAYNYYTGERLFNEGDKQKLSLSEFFKASYNRNNIANGNTSYENSNELKETLDNLSNEEIIRILDNLNNQKTNNVPIKDNGVATDENVQINRNKLSQEYVVSYNSSTNSYEVYDIEDLLNEDVSEPISLDTKIRNNKFLYDYFYDGTKVNDSLSNNRLIIYISIFVLIIINLIYLSTKFKKRGGKA